MTETCQHDIAEMETAIADGMCPLCLSRRLREAEEMLDLGPVTALLKRVEQAEAALEQMTARCAVMTDTLQWYGDPIAYSMPVQDMNHHVFPDRGDRARKVLTFTHASVEKLLAIKRAAEEESIHHLDSR